MQEWRNFPGQTRAEVQQEPVDVVKRATLWMKEGTWCTEKIATQRDRVAQDVHAAQLSGTRGLRFYVTSTTMSNVCPMRDTHFSNLVMARIHVVNASRKGQCWVTQFARTHEWEEKT